MATDNPICQGERQDGTPLRPRTLVGSLVRVDLQMPNNWRCLLSGLLRPNSPQIPDTRRSRTPVGELGFARPGTETTCTSSDSADARESCSPHSGGRRIAHSKSGFETLFPRPTYPSCPRHRKQKHDQIQPSMLCPPQESARFHICSTPTCVDKGNKGG